MTAWAYIILSQMGFNQLESLSLASVFTSVTSTQHALNLGNIYTAEQERDARLEMSQLPGKRRKSDEAGEGEGNSQPWVGVMRRRLPVIQLADKTWRGLSKGMAVEPEKVRTRLVHVEQGGKLTRPACRLFLISRETSRRRHLMSLER
jgi:hypothetical protein